MTKRLRRRGGCGCADLSVAERRASGHEDLIEAFYPTAHLIALAFSGFIVIINFPFSISLLLLYDSPLAKS